MMLCHSPAVARAGRPVATPSFDAATVDGTASWNVGCDLCALQRQVLMEQLLTGSSLQL
jgi:hypothetical protein